MPYWQERFNNTNYDPDMNNQNQQKLNEAGWQTIVHELIQELCEKIIVVFLPVNNFCKNINIYCKNNFRKITQ